MPKIPAALTFFIAATMTGCASTVKKPDNNKAKQACISEVANKPIVVSHDTATHVANISPRHNAHSIQTGRYSVIKTGQTQDQSKLLDVMITVTIPNNIQTIRETVKYLLKRSGYRMAPEPVQEQEVSQFLSKQLPSIHRKIGPMKLIDALNMLTSPAFVLVDHPVKREIGYRLKLKFQPGVA